MRRALLAAAAIAAVSACTPQELNRWGAQLRGAPVNVSYRGHPHYVVGPAQYPRDECEWAVVTFEPWVDPGIRSTICTPNRGFVEGEYGYRRNG